MQIGTSLKIAMLIRNVTIRDLVGLTGIPERTLYSYCNNKTEPRHRNLVAIANGLEITALDLITLEQKFDSLLPPPKKLDD